MEDILEAIWDILVNLHWGAIGQIIMIDILLGGDNAVVIAMACRNLPHEQRKLGIFWGTTGAIALRVILITFAVMLLDLPFLKVAGGVLLLWIGMKLLIPDDGAHDKIEGSGRLMGAIKTIIVADFVMSFDNVIAIAGAAQQAHEAHQTLLIIFGLVVSVPFIVFGSQVILKLLDRFPIIIYFGGGLLGWIAGGMVVSDAWVMEHWAAAPSMHYPAAVVGALIVATGSVSASKRKSRRGTRRRPKPNRETRQHTKIEAPSWAPLFVRVDQLGSPVTHPMVCDVSMKPPPRQTSP